MTVGVKMGSRSFNAWDSVSKILDGIQDGRYAWRHKHLPVTVSVRELIGEKVVGTPWDSRSKFINEAILHYHRTERVEGMSCSDAALAIKAYQTRIEALEEELKGYQGVRGLWRVIRG